MVRDTSLRHCHQRCSHNLQRNATKSNKNFQKSNDAGNRTSIGVCKGAVSLCGCAVRTDHKSPCQCMMHRLSEGAIGVLLPSPTTNVESVSSVDMFIGTFAKWSVHLDSFCGFTSSSSTIDFPSMFFRFRVSADISSEHASGSLGIIDAVMVRIWCGLVLGGVAMQDVCIMLRKVRLYNDALELQRRQKQGGAKMSGQSRTRSA